MPPNDCGPIPFAIPQTRQYDSERWVRLCFRIRYCSADENHSADPAPYARHNLSYAAFLVSVAETGRSEQTLLVQDEQRSCLRLGHLTLRHRNFDRGQYC
jgi:hypothetical protein